MTPVTQLSSTPSITAIVLGVILAAVGVYDLWAGLYWGPPNTITTVVQEYSKRHPIIPLAVGMLIGHLFWTK